MNVLLVAGFMVLLGVEAAGTLTFLVIYLRDGSWRTSAVGRHLAYYGTALLGLYVTTLVSFFVRDAWLVVVILGLHAVFAGVIWQRVWLVSRSTRLRR